VQELKALQARNINYYNIHLTDNERLLRNETNMLMQHDAANKIQLTFKGAHDATPIMPGKNHKTIAAIRIDYNDGPKVVDNRMEEDINKPTYNFRS